MADLSTKNGRPLPRSGDKLFARSGTYVGKIKGDYVFDRWGRYAGTSWGSGLSTARRTPLGSRVLLSRRTVGGGAGNRGASGMSGDEPPFPD